MKHHLVFEMLREFDKQLKEKNLKVYSDGKGKNLWVSKEE